MPKSKGFHSTELKQVGQLGLGNGAVNEEEHAEVHNLLSGQVTGAGAVMHFALCLCPSSCYWAVSGSLSACVVRWARRQRQGGVRAGD